jgi:hypothetical protein
LKWSLKRGGRRKGGGGRDESGRNTEPRSVLSVAAVTQLVGESQWRKTEPRE